MQFFTRTKWWVIPLVWVPVAMAMFYMALVVENIPLYKMPGHCVFGAFCWTLVEYLLHRFLFHMKTTSYWLVRLSPQRLVLYYSFGT